MQASIYKITPFDATAGTKIRFSWYGNQVFKNRCIIKTNDTNETVYDKTVESFKFEHDIDLSAASLTNGKKYIAFVTVFDKDNQESDSQQLGELFLCLKTPQFKFTNIHDDQIIESSSYNFTLSYSQENGELLDSWSISAYNRAHTLLSESGVNYDTATMEYTFSGFSNKNEYCIRAIGTTVNGVKLDTGFINVSVTYQLKDVFSILEPTNMADTGAIQIRSNIVSSEGHLKNPATYIDGKFIDLRGNELTYREGFLYKGDFSLVIVFYGASFNQRILKMYADDSNTLSAAVTYRAGKFGTETMRGYYELRVASNGVSSVFNSNIIDLPSDTDHIGLCLSRKDGFYNIEITNLEDGGNE